ncbi:uncharacterized protein LOC111322287 isoform X2 [Stylophora pistillata]|uniref:uncharacterized protein LOC111322287 isoform X2 n=1 Tax=Stylophora pistillata TaxID=50429 RepID=UPI000C04626E|nr:uncharacterized protein LOC111322287 isoform X2 [Stylophora pistillata]
MSLFHTTFVLWLALVLISHEVSGEIETLVEEPGPNLWYWAVFKEISEGFGWSHPSTQSQSYSVCDIASINDEPKNWLRTEYIYIKGECTDPHSLKRNNQKIFGVCLSNGEWNITNSSACLCSYGYELTNGSSDSFVCKECQKGFYKDSVGSEKCVPCPENSASNIDRNGCMCNEGYYRSSIVADCEVFVKVINITMVITSESCTDEKYDESSLLARVEEVMEEAFAGRFSGFKSVHLKSSIRCGSITFDLALIFNYKAKEQDVITVLRNASKDGKLGDFIVSTIKETRSQVDFETGNTETGTITPPGSVTGIITGAVVGCVVAIAVAVGIFVFFLWKQRRRKSKKPNNRGFIKASFGP